MLLTTLLSRALARRANVTANAPRAGADWLRHVAALSPDELLAEIGTRASGLAEDEVAQMRAFWGENSLGGTERPSLPRRVLAAFLDPFTGILVLIAIVSVLTDWVFARPGARDLTTPAIIAVMVVVSGTLRLVQDERSDNASAALAEMVETTCCVERAGSGRVELPVDELVVGDVVHLSSGDLVPADLRLIFSRDLFVSQSALTGESESVEKRRELAEGAGAAANVAVTDLDDLVFLGSSVISGAATGVVVATGAATLMGEAASGLASAEGRGRTTASGEGVARTSRLLVTLMLVMVPTVVLVSGLTKGNWVDAVLFSLSVAVGLTPEMLPALVTCCLGKGAVDLSRDRVIVKRLDAVSDLGAIDVLCCDKTGTLTEDRVALERHLDVRGAEDPGVLRAAFVNSFFGTGVKNLIDSAILRRALELDPSVEELCERYDLVDELPFDFERRRLSVVVGDRTGDTLMICKGALEEVLDACAFAELDGRAVPLSPSLADDVSAQAEALAAQGMRVLGVALRENPEGVGRLTAADEKNMTLVGLLAFLDPPKASAAEAVAALADHGVETKVLTGDSPRVAAHVCRAIGIPVGDVLTGSEIEALDDAALARRLRDVSVLAKLSPSQKARVVSALRGEGRSVGFMGDGVNDAAAMAASDCGISVDSAVDVAREAADLILLEKDLLVLERGIVCGRRTLANMTKYVKVTVSSNFGNIFSVLAASLLLPFLPMSAVQLLLLNLVYDLTCTAIPWDSVDDELVRAPRRWDSASIRRFMVSLGPVSSVFDLLTFAALFFVVCPGAAGGPWGALDDAGRALFVATFQAGWLVESMWTQTLAVHLVRTQRAPFVESRAAAPLTALGVTGVALVTALPFTPLGEALDLAPLPLPYFALLAGIVGLYAAVLLLARGRFVRRNGTLL
ncbi:MAG TPA: magnesium-translocating P-type ATPase [Candidatus Olsenella avicola]|nr:magnesium-translocating P-type ATPase [Candidatus Olsenella avicola]